MIAQNGNHVPAVIESGAMKQGTKLPSMSFLIKPAFSLCNLRCKDCNWLPICHGGCKRDITFKGDEPENYYCSAFKFLFEYASERLMEVARAEIEAMRRSAGKPY